MRAAVDRDELARLLPGCEVVGEPGAVAAVNGATFPTIATSKLIVRPGSHEALIAAVALCAARKLRFHVVSRAKNWGFGSAVPVRDVELLLDLSRMDQILAYDPVLGTIRVEPGVTFGQLSAFLVERGDERFANVIGGSAQASVVGNILERGDGVGPYCERSEYACAAEVVLASGEVAQLGFANVRGSRVADLCRSSLGPGLQELFVQSNLGVVSKLTLWLCAKPREFRSVYFGIERHASMASMLTKLQGLYRRRILSAPLTFWNDYKQVAGSIRYPWQAQPEPPPLRRSTLRAISNRYNAWIGFGGLYVDHRRIGRLVERELFRELRPEIRSPSPFSRLSPAKIAVFRALNVVLSGTKLSFDELLDSWERHPLLGHPSERSVRSLVWRKRGAEGDAAAPERTGCGVLWNSFNMPFDGPAIAEALAQIDGRILDAGFEPMISFVAVNERYVKAFVQLVFDREIAGEDQKALACHGQVFSLIESAGYSHNRLDIHSMARAGNMLLDDSLHRAIKDALDPDGLIAPGRYFMGPRKGSP